MFRLDNQRALVTGAGNGVGEAIARRLAFAGAAVAIAGLDGTTVESVAASIRGKSFKLQADVHSANSSEAAVTEVINLNQQVDILVNSAGIAGRAAPTFSIALMI